MNKIVVPVSIIAALGAGVFAIVKMNSAGTAQAEYDRLAADVAAQNQKLADAVAALNSTNDQLSFLKENNERLTKERDDAIARAKEAAANGEKNAGIAESDAGRDQGAKNGGEALRNIMEGFAKQMDDPEVKKMMQSGQTRLIEQAYGKLFDSLNLSASDKALVTELISDRNVAALDKARKLMGGKSDDAAAQSVRAEIEATKQDYDTKLKSVLGEAKFSELNNYERTVRDERALDRFSRSFDSQGMALQPQQKDSLLGIMKEERLKNPVNEIPDLGGGPGMAVLYTEEEAKAQQQREEAYQQSVIGRAGQAGLSPDQVTVLQDSFKRQNERQTMGRAMGRAFLGGFGGQSGAK